MTTQWIVDAFTTQPFKGNSAAVILVEEYPDNEWMLNVAAENNLSETAYLKRLDHNHYYIRWFSPITEIDFCGHATLASAFVLFNELSHTGEIRFSTNDVGDLTVVQGACERIEMTFPILMPCEIDEVPEALVRGLSIEPSKVLRSKQAYFAIYESKQHVVSLTTQNEPLKTLAPYDVVATAPGSDVQYDFVSRYFWPANGGDEDPVTGSIHAGLMPYWAERLGKSKLTALQASKRSGILYGEVLQDSVCISGNAVLFAKSTLNV